MQKTVHVSLNFYFQVINQINIQQLSLTLLFAGLSIICFLLPSLWLLLGGLRYANHGSVWVMEPLTHLRLWFCSMKYSTQSQPGYFPPALSLLACSALIHCPVPFCACGPSHRRPAGEIILLGLCSFFVYVSLAVGCSSWTSLCCINCRVEIKSGQGRTTGC